MSQKRYSAAELAEFDLTIDNITVAYRENRESPWERPRVCLSSSGFSLCLQGDYLAQVQDKNIHVKANDILFLKAGDYYHAKSLSLPFAHIGVHFITNENINLPYRTIYTPANLDEFKGLFWALSNIWAKKNPGYKLRAKSLLYEIAAGLLSGIQSGFHSPVLPLIKDAVSYLESNYLKRMITTEDLAEHAHLSVSHFIRLFKQLYGTTPIQYINQMRIRFAAELLLNTTFSVKEIAGSIGYTDSAYFCRMFKKIMGMPPSQYQNKHNELLE